MFTSKDLILALIIMVIWITAFSIGYIKGGKDEERLHEKSEIPNNNKKKEEMLRLLAKENDMVLSQAYLYAVNLDKYGVNIVEKWLTATQQSEALYKAYIRGRIDEEERIHNGEKVNVTLS